MESLGLAPAETAFFTGADPLSDWHELYGFATKAEAITETTDPETSQRIDLLSAKALSRRLGVTFKDITEIVQTGFVNPRLTKLALLYKLGVTIQDARFYQEHKPFYEDNKDLIGQDRGALSSADQQRFDQLSDEVSDTGISGWDIVNEVAAFKDRLDHLSTAFDTPLDGLQAFLEDLPFGEILVLADPDAGCNFELTTLQHDDATKAQEIDFLRINLFVRLWRKLGWSIEETDRALSTFIPSSALFDEDPAHLVQQPLKTALIYLAHLKALDEKVQVGKHSRLKLLALWSDIATTGKKPLYAQLFLPRSVLKSAPVFDHPLGRYLTDPSIKLADHVLALQGALGLTAGEIGSILEDNSQSLDNAELSLPTVSLLYRYALLAKALKLSVRELIVLKQLSGLDPFKPLHPDPLATIEEDHPFSQTLRFVEIAGEVKGNGLKIEALDYLLRHRFDEAGTYRPDREATLALLKTLAEGVRAIRAEHAIPDDPGTLAEEVLRQKLGLALPPDVVERFLAMMNDTVEFTATRRGVEPADEQLEPEAFADEERIRGLNYQEVPHKEQKLTFRGVLFDAQKTELLTRFDGVLTAPQKSVFADLLDGVQKQARSFFKKHLQKQPPNAQPVYGFLDATDFEVLFAPFPEIEENLKEDEKTAARKAIERQRKKKLTILGKGFFPFLQQRLIRQFIVETMTAYTGADPALVESLVTDERLLAVEDSKPLLAAFAATGEQGVSASFFDSDDLSGAPQAETSIVRSADTALNPLDLANSARFEGCLEVPTPGAYRFTIVLDKQNAEAELHFDHLPDSVFLSGVAAADNATLVDQPDEFVELKPGIPYRFSLELEKLDGGGARLLVQGETLPKDAVSQLTLYPLSAVLGPESAILLLTKTLQLVERLGLSEREIRYLLTHASDFGGVNLSDLPAHPVGDTPDEQTATTQRFQGFLRLAAYARLKRDLAGGTDDLIGIFEANEAGGLSNVYPLIATLTRRDEATVKATAEAQASDPDFRSEEPLGRLWEALQIVERFGVPVASLLGWTHIVSPAAMPEQRFEIARDLKEAIKARFAPESWQCVAQPIFDKLRQRGALGSHVMYQHGFDRLEQLYEYFLIDPGMEPVVQTSRIRLAIASLQLFIQRCLLNLEVKVQPSTINSRHWEWMKRCRVWGANRKIFLFQENWLEPEFRDNKTHLFSELEGALLQGDVSSNLAEDDFLNYLKKLDELARLDVVAMHIEDDPDPTRRTLHVFGRTFSQPHKYFYRRYTHQMWTPWEPVSSKIQGDHLAPVVWRDRLYLFWVTFMDKPDENAKPGTSSGGKKLAEVELSAVMSDVKAAGKKKQIDVQLHWSEYLQGEWSTRESGDFLPWTKKRIRNGIELMIPRVVSLSFDHKSVFVHVSKSYDLSGDESGVTVHLQGPENFRFSFYLAGRNSAPEKATFVPGPANPYGPNSVRANRYIGSGPLTVAFKQRITTEPGEAPKAPAVETPSILKQGSRHTLLPCDNKLTAFGVTEEAFQDAADPGAVAAALERGLGEIASLMKPVFYQDNQHTLFVEPDVTERTIEEWQEWVTPTPRPEPGWQIPDWWKNLVVIAEMPRKGSDLGPGDPRLGVEIDAGSLIKPKPAYDWLVNPTTVLEFDKGLIGPVGQAGLQIRPAGAAAVALGGTAVNVTPGSGLASGGTVVLTNVTTLEQSGLVEAAGGLNVVGNAGFNSALAQHFT